MRRDAAIVGHLTGSAAPLGFLGRAKKMMKGPARNEPPRPQYYSVACPEGHIVRGTRTDGYQAIRCPSCGEGIFVLPRSPLPQPQPPSSSRSRPKPVRAALPIDEEPIALTEAPPQVEELSDEPIAEIEWMDPEAEAGLEVEAAVEADTPEPPRPPSPRPRPAPQAAPAAETPETAARPRVRPKKAPAPTPAEPQPAVAVVARKKRSPHLYLLAGVAALVVATVGYRQWKQRMQTLPHEAEVNRVEGIAALERGEVDDARNRLEIAVRAYKQLGVSDENSRATEQAAQEAAILARLDSRTLKEIVEEVARRGEPDGPDWFKIHEGQTIFVEEEFTDTPRYSASGTLELDYRIFTGRGPAASREGRIDLEGLNRLENQKFRKGDILRLGAKLKSIRLDRNVWIITLEPDSGVFMTNEKALQAARLIPSGEGAGL